MHRDIKPGNVLLCANDFPPSTVKLGDFGLARKVMSAEGSSHSQGVGTPWYLSPERLKYNDYDMPSDMWALGLTLYEMLAGKDNFPFPNYTAIL